MPKKIIILLSVFFVGLIAFLSNISTIAGYLGIKPDSLFWIIFSPLLTAWQWLIKKQEISGWLIIIISLLLLVSLRNFFVEIQDSRSPYKYTKYIKDNISNIEWHWRWSMMGEVADIRGYCPSCHSEVLMRDTTAGRNEFSYDIVCPRCEKVLTSGMGAQMYVMSKVRKEIERIARQKYGKH